MADLVATRLVSSIQRSKSAVVAWFGIRSLGAPPLAPASSAFSMAAGYTRGAHGR